MPVINIAIICVLIVGLFCLMLFVSLGDGDDWKP